MFMVTANNSCLKALMGHRYKSMTFCAIIIACVLITIMLVFHYRVHLLWLYARHRLELNNFTSFQSRQMPYVPVPPIWGNHRLGEMELSLPPEFYADNDDANRVMLYQHETKTVLISLPEDYHDLFVTVCSMYNLRPQHSISTLPMLRHECYRAASTEFSWSISSSDVQRHISCALFTKTLRLMQDAKAELLANDEIEGLAIMDRNKTEFEWQCKKTSLGGHIHFHNGDESEINDADNDWIRAVCQSIKIFESCPEK